ncbi:MAG: serine/threonine-protein kinase [candidate division Zixibacteria bacterium]|nr:serine/threonine-protein kinase [candidate division Zixibacteria bacterium]
MNDNFIGHYRILKKMGAGGMARVYLAVHRDIPNLRVVLKILTDHQLADRFKQEADKLALVDGHPNICRIRHFFDHGEDLVIAMDYIDGPTVEQRIRTTGPLGYDEAIAIISQVLDVLEFAHSRGISHRDIKPSNIMIDEHGRVKVIDFGIAKGERDPSMTAVNAYAGTPDYMAPEQFSPSRDTNYALADIYAVGVTFYEMLCGELPFDAKDLFAIRDAKMFQEPKNPRRYRPDMSKHLEQVILKAMHREPENRFQSAREMKEYLLAGAARDTSRRTPPPTPAPVAVSREPRKRRLPAFLLGAVVLAGLTAAGYYVVPGMLAEKSASVDRDMDVPGQMQPEQTPEPATGISLISPIEGAEFSDGDRPEFLWSSTEGVPEFAVEFSTDSMFSHDEFTFVTAESRLVRVEPLASGRYYWRVRAAGAALRGDIISEARSFTVLEDSASIIESEVQQRGELEIVTNRPSTIRIDGRTVEQAAREYQTVLDAGEYDVRVDNASSREGTLSARVTVEPGRSTTHRFEFTDGGSVSVRVSSDPPGARILINGEMQNGVGTPHTFTLSTGQYVISAISDESGNLSLQQTVEVKSGELSEVRFDFVGARARAAASKLADSVSAAVALLDDIARRSPDFASAQASQQAAQSLMANGRYDEAIEQYRDALASVSRAAAAKDVARRKVMEALERFGQAYQSGDINAVRAMYPSIPGDEASGWEQFFESARGLSVRMTVDEMTVEAASAQVTVTVRMMFSDRQGKKDQSFRWLIHFEETGSTWVVAKRQTL